MPPATALHQTFPVSQDGASMRVDPPDHNWERRPGYLVADLVHGRRFQELDKKLPYRLPLDRYQELMATMYIATTDVILATREPKKVLCVVRNNEPIKDFRWILGGRSTLVPESHAWRDLWDKNPDLCNVLLTLYSETGLQPSAISRVTTPIASSTFTFRWAGEKGPLQRTNKSSLFVAEVPSIPELSLDSQSRNPQWLDFATYQRERNQFCEAMRTYLDTIFHNELMANNLASTLSGARLEGGVLVFPTRTA